MSDQVDNVIATYKNLTNLIRSSWGPNYIIKPEKLAEVQEAQRNTEAEVGGIDSLSLKPEDEIRLRKAKEEYLIQTNPEVEMERRRSEGREV